MIDKIIEEWETKLRCLNEIDIYKKQIEDIDFDKDRGQKINGLLQIANEMRRDWVAAHWIGLFLKDLKRIKAENKP